MELKMILIRIIFKNSYMLEKNISITKTNHSVTFRETAFVYSKILVNLYFVDKMQSFLMLE
jgi:hypothetical protein